MKLPFHRGTGYIEHLKKTMQNPYKSIQDRAWLAMQHQKNVYDEKQNQHQCYQKGDCLFYCPAVPRSHSPKFHQPWQGPYEVEKQMSDAVYGIRKKTLELSNLLFIITDLSHNFNQ